jgi:hypothetical protein
MRVVEYVTFILAPGASDAAFLEAARATEALVRRQPGFLSRRLWALTRGKDHVNTNGQPLEGIGRQGPVLRGQITRRAGRSSRDRGRS